MEIEECIKETREKCPYPLDIFVSKELEGRVGRHCHSVWNNALDKLEEIMERKKQEELESRNNIISD